MADEDDALNDPSLFSSLDNATFPILDLDIPPTPPAPATRVFAAPPLASTQQQQHQQQQQHPPPPPFAAAPTIAHGTVAGHTGAVAASVHASMPKTPVTGTKATPARTPAPASVASVATAEMPPPSSSSNAAAANYRAASTAPSTNFVAGGAFSGSVEPKGNDPTGGGSDDYTTPAAKAGEQPKISEPSAEIDPERFRRENQDANEAGPPFPSRKRPMLLSEMMYRLSERAVRRQKRPLPSSPIEVIAELAPVVLMQPLVSKRVKLKSENGSTAQQSNGTSKETDDGDGSTNANEKMDVDGKECTSQTQDTVKKDICWRDRVKRHQSELHDLYLHGLVTVHNVTNLADAPDAILPGNE